MDIFSSIKQTFSQIGTIRIMDIIDIALVAVLLYFIIMLIRRTRTSKVFMGILIILLALWLSGEIQLYTVNYILRSAVQIGLLALVVLFQPEIRRFLETLGNGTPFTMLFGGERSLTSENAITQTVLACTDLSKTRTGALIIFERSNRLEEQIRTGTILDAETTAELLKNIFYPKAPLHDGAVIIRNGRIEAAGCMLPLSENPNLSRDLGMRHRAGIGMSEATDALVVIVSEETGGISVAESGMLKRHLSRDTFEKLLRNGLLTEQEEQTPFSLFRKKDKGNIS
ncbi:MAG: diadenylate cyclase CdaA [Oscillospiraceae bacterium]|nr:diadenylate cyclase CdaA [Oscillospiraceae bacterium]